MKRQETNRGYENDAPSRSGSKENIEMQPMGVYVSSQQTQVQYGMAQYEVPYREVQGYGHPGPQQYADPRVQMQEFGRQGPQQYVHPSVQMQGYGHLGPQPYADPRVQMQYGHPGPQMIPAPQYMARDSTTPMPADFETEGPTVQPLIWFVIIKRIFSAILIIFDSILSWWHFATLFGGSSEMLEKFELLNDLFHIRKSKGSEALQCEGSDESYWIPLKATFTAISTVWACFQIVNMIGETLIEYRFSREKENAVDIENSAGTQPTNKHIYCFRGFQIVHGWVETLVSLLCGDLPQAILAILIGVNRCSIDTTSMPQTIVWMIIKSLKNDVRATTCKQKYKPCCYYLCKDCCVWYYDFPCLCSTFIFRLCGICTDEKVCECQFYKLCPDGCCFRGEQCCGNIDSDPQWARRTTLKLEEYYVTICIVAIILKAIKGSVD